MKNIPFFKILLFLTPFSMYSHTSTVGEKKKKNPTLYTCFLVRASYPPLNTCKWPPWGFCHLDVHWDWESQDSKIFETWDSQFHVSTPMHRGLNNSKVLRAIWAPSMRNLRACIFFSGSKFAYLIYFIYHRLKLAKSFKGHWALCLKILRALKIFWGQLARGSTLFWPLPMHVQMS